MCFVGCPQCFFFFLFFLWHILKSPSQNHYFKDNKGNGRQRKKTLLPFMVKLGFLSAFVCFSDVFSFDQYHLTSCLKECSLQFWSLPIITSVLQPAVKRAGRCVLSWYWTNPSLGTKNSHLERINSVLGHYTGVKIQVAELGSLTLLEFSYMCKILHCTQFSSVNLSSLVFGMATFLLILKYHFLSYAQKMFLASPLHMLLLNPKTLDAKRSAPSSISEMCWSQPVYAHLMHRPKTNALAVRSCRRREEAKRNEMGIAVICELCVLCSWDCHSQNRAADTLCLVYYRMWKWRSTSLPGAKFLVL